MHEREMIPVRKQNRFNELCAAEIAMQNTFSRAHRRSSTGEQIDFDMGRNKAE